MNGLHVRDEESTLEVVIQVEALAPAEIKSSIHGPAVIGLEFKTHAWNQYLRGGKTQVLYPPRPHHLTQPGDGKFLAELVLQSGPGSGGEVLANQRTEEQIAHGISRDERAVAPGTAHLKLNTGAHVA